MIDRRPIGAGIDQAPTYIDRDIGTTCAVAVTPAKLSATGLNDTYVPFLRSKKLCLWDYFKIYGK